MALPLRSLPILLLALAACGSPEAPEQDPQPTVPDAAPEAPQGRRKLCFLNVTRSTDAPPPGKDQLPVVDSLSVRINIDGERVTGRYDFLPAQKDRMKGSLEGTIANDTITVVYSYKAEGIAAKEEKVFRLKDDQLWMLSGELEERNGVWTIRDRSKAVWSQALAPVPCR